MISNVTTPTKLNEIFRSRDFIAKDHAHLSKEWIQQGGAKVIASEGYEPVAEVEALPLSRAFLSSSNGKLYAVTTGDDGQHEDLVCELDSSPEDLAELSSVYFARNFLLFSIDLRCAVLFNHVGEYKLLAGPLEFLIEYWGDPKKQRDLFVDLIEDQISVFRASENRQTELNNVLRYMDWIDAQN